MRKNLMLPTLAFALTMGACGGDPIGTGAQLSSVERQLAVSFLFDQAVAQVVASPLSQSAARSGPDAALQPFEDEVMSLIDCSVSGTIDNTIQIDGLVDDETGALDLSFTVAQVHNACVEESVEQNVSLQFEGNPAIVANFDLTRDADGEVSTTGSLVGTLTVTTETVSVACSISMNFSGTGGEVGSEFGFVGSFCGAPFQGTFTVAL